MLHNVANLIATTINSSKPPIIWLLGGSGSGKGTQNEKIIAKYGFTHLSIDDLLRAEAKGDSKRAKRLINILERGGSGSGKGTQNEKIIAKYGFTHLSIDDLLRAEAKGDSKRAKRLINILERGELVPNDVVLDLLKKAMIAKVDEAKGFLIDGYPREKSQGMAFEETIAPVTVIIYFEASSDTLTKRLLGRAANSGRFDDNEETIKLRLKTFHENNDLVLVQYSDKLRRINAEDSVEYIFSRVQQVLDPTVA